MFECNIIKYWTQSVASIRFWSAKTKFRDQKWISTSKSTYKCAEVQRLTQMLVVTRHNVPNANFDHNFALQFHDLLSLYEGIVNIEQLFLDHRKTSWSYQILARLDHTLDTTINKINYKSNIKNLVIWYEIRTMNHSQLFGTNIISSTDYKSSTVTETK